MRKTAATTIESSPSVPGIVEPGVIYTLPELMQRANLGTEAMRSARRDGLIVRYLANRAYVSGDDFINYVLSKASTSK